MLREPYFHVQTSPLRYAVLAVVALSLLAAWYFRAEFWGWLTMATVAGVFYFIFLTMTTLTTRGEADALVVQFGPLPLFFLRVPYEDIQKAEVGRLMLIEGWSFQYSPFRGWTWSLWGLRCVNITRSRSLLRIGTDDAENLASFLDSRILKNQAG